MTILIPNWLIEEQPETVIFNENCIFSVFSSRDASTKRLVRTTSHLLMVKQSGLKKVYLEEDEIQLDNQKVLFLAQGNYFMRELQDETNECSAFLFFLEDQFLLDFIKKHIPSHHAPSQSSRSYVAQRTHALNSVIDSVAHYAANTNIHKYNLMHLKAEEILLNMLDQDSDSFCSFLFGATENASSRILSILDANLDILDDVKQMASLCRMSENRLRREIMSLTGLTPKRWLLEQRLKKAAMMLKNSEESVSAIATSCGFATPSWFTAQFKETYHLTPLDYRVKNR